MKSIRKNLNLITFCLLVSIFGCKSNKTIDITEKRDIQLKATGVIGKKASCVCTAGYFNSFCSPCVSSNLMMGTDVARYKITWDICETQDPFADPLCRKSGQSNFTSYATFCYGVPTPPSYDNCNLMMEIDALPSCIGCITTTFPYCVSLTARCSSTNGNDYHVYLDDNDPNTPAIVEYQYTINRDETKIKLCCTKTNASGQVNTYCCTGFMIYAP